MADTKTSALADGGNIQATDQVPVNRGGTNARVVVTKTALGLGNVDNTSNATERAATATLTNKTIAGGSNTISGITETMLSTSDITTLDVSTSKHGFAPKAPNDSTKFLNGVGAWAVPAGGGGGGSGNVVAPSAAVVVGEVALFDATNGQLLKGSGAAPLTAVTTSAGAADVGKAVILDSTGKFDISAIPNIPAATKITGIVPIANLASGTPTGAKFIRDDGTLATPAGATPTTTEGDIIVRGSSADQRLAIGSNTFVLTVDTAVSGKLKWAAGGGGSGTILVGLQDFRLTTQTAVPVSSSDRTSQSTIYFTPYKGNQISLYNGSSWDTISSAEVSLALSGLTSGKNYDVFAYNNSGTLTLELSAAWTNDSTRSAAVTTQDGVVSKTGALTRRLVGTIRTSGTTTTEDTELKRFVWNANNQVLRAMNFVTAGGTNHSYGTSLTIREWNGASGGAARMQFVSGSPISFLAAVYMEIIADGGASLYGYGSISIGDAASFGAASVMTGATQISSHTAPGAYQSVLGYNDLILVENCFVGTSGNATFNSGKMTALVPL